MKKFLIALVVLCLAGAAAAFWGYQQLQRTLKSAVTVQENQLLTIERGTNASKLAQLLEQEKISNNTQYLPYLLKLNPQLNKIKAGTYALNGIKTLEELLQLLNSGKEVQLSVRFIDGETFKSWQKVLQNAPHLQQTLKDKSEQEIFALLGLPAQTHLTAQKLEGWIYPDTYNYTPKTTDLALLKRASDRMQKALATAWEGRDPNLPLKTPYEMLTLASIVEKETAVNTERGKVASVFINRLNRKMKLQTDPTVIYGMGERYQGNIRKVDLQEATPYNTYVIEGLPPTPIAMPSESALIAVSKPEKTDFLYFVADGTGGHKFSKSLAEHNKAVQEYLRWYREKNKK